LFLGDRNTLPVEKKKKKDFGCVLVFCNVGRPVLWLLALSVVVGIWWTAKLQWPSERKKKSGEYSGDAPAMFPVAVSW
jgi:hypothetical protein